MPRLPFLTPQRLERVLESPAMRALVDEQEREELVARQALADELAAEARRWEAERKPLAAAVERTRATLEHARASLAEAAAAARSAERGLAIASGAHDGRAHHLERELRAGADPSLAAFRAELGDLEQAAMGRTVRVYHLEHGAEIVERALPPVRLDEITREGELNPYTHPPRRSREVVASNRRSVLARLEAIRAARATLDALALAPLSAGQVAAELEALRASIPEATLDTAEASA